MVELTYPSMFTTDSTGTCFPYADGEKINALIRCAARPLEMLVKSASHIFTNSEERNPSPDLWLKTNSVGIDMPYNALMNVTTTSMPIVINNGKKHPGKRISLSEAYEQAGHIYENAEAKRQVQREQEARLFFGLLGDE